MAAQTNFNLLAKHVCVYLREASTISGYVLGENIIGIELDERAEPGAKMRPPVRIPYTSILFVREI